MQTTELVPHPAFAPLGIRSVTAGKDLVGAWLRLRWKVEGSQSVILPPFTGRRRADELWQTTCFELFVKPESGAAYSEFNFSPSESWAAYDFAGWRDGMTERSISHDPVITPRAGRSVLIFDVAIPLADLPTIPAEISLTAVIEEDGGRKSYWAMAHGNPEAPDFHDPSCFAATLAPPLNS